MLELRPRALGKNAVAERLAVSAGAVAAALPYAVDEFRRRANLP